MAKGQINLGVRTVTIRSGVWRRAMAGMKRRVLA